MTTANFIAGIPHFGFDRHDIPDNVIIFVINVLFPSAEWKDFGINYYDYAVKFVDSFTQTLLKAEFAHKMGQKSINI